MEEAFPPVPFDRVRSRATARRRRDALMREFSARSGDHNRGGSTQRALVTAYREEALFIAQCLEANGPASPRALRLWILDDWSKEQTEQLVVSIAKIKGGEAGATASATIAIRDNDAQWQTPPAAK